MTISVNYCFMLVLIGYFVLITPTVVAQASTSFVTTWKTDNSGQSANDQITIPTSGVGYNYTVDWGDATTPTVETGDAIHTYANPGTYTVSINGDFPGIYFSNTGDKDKILSIEQWGDISWESMSYAFWGCTNLVGNFVDAPDLSKVSHANYMFAGATVFNTSLNNWDVSNITEMVGMFSKAVSFNGDISNWDVGNVVDMTILFDSAQAFNQDISKWNTANVKSMRNMFFGATIFNQDISDWNVSNVTDMRAMFNVAESFNQNINSWDTSNVNNMHSMFNTAKSFNQDLSAWDVGNVVDMSSMFNAAKSFNQNINSWNISKVNNIQWMFGGAESFNQYVGDWDVSNVTNMIGVFKSAKSFNQSINSWNISKVDKMQWMFADAISFNQDLSNWNVRNVTNMDGMFVNALMFDQNIGTWNIENLTRAMRMFEGAKLSVANYDALLIGWNSQNLKTNVSFDGGNSKYCAGASARANMISSDNWNILDEGVASTSVDPLADQNKIGSFTLPKITGIDLFGNEAFYTGPNGTGTIYNVGEVINYLDFPIYPTTLYIYGGYNANCSSEQSFELVIESSVPLCTSLSLPLNGEINVSTNTNLTWSMVSDATGYRLTLGTSSGGTDILNGFDVGSVLSYDLTSDLPKNTTIYVNIVPYNLNGEAVACLEENFTTELLTQDNQLPPKFFTPNNDNINDYWIVSDTSNLVSSIFIYNRYGKLLKQVASISKGWDGTLNGKPLPVDDYWYLIAYKDGNMLKGHFSLVR